MTSQQHACFTFIKAHIASTGASPSYEELQAHLGLASKSGVHGILARLRDQGLINWRFGVARSIVVVDRDAPLKLAARIVVEKHEAGRLQPGHIQELRRALEGV